MRIIALCLILVLSFSCSSEKEKTTSKEPTPEFTEYVNAYTSGEVSNQSVIEIHLSKPVKNLEQVKEKSNDLFSIKPSVEGEVVWRDDRTIVFEPKDLLKSSQEYQVKFELDELYDVPSDLSTFPFSFKVKSQYIIVNTNGLEPYSEDNLKQQKLSGTVRTTDYAESEKVEQLFQALQADKKLTTNWEHSADGKSHAFVLENITRSDEESEISLNWDGQAIQSKSNSSKTVTIPSLNTFSLFNVTKQQGKEQSIIINFSDPLNTEQELEGLIHLSNNTPLRFTIDGTKVIATLKKPIFEQVTLHIETSVRNTMGYRLSKKESETIRFTSTKPDIELLGEGTIVPDQNGIHFPFKAVNLSGVNVRIIQIFENNVHQFLQENQLNGTEDLNYVGRILFQQAVDLESDHEIDYGQWNNFSLDLSKYLETEPGAIYNIQISFDKSQSLYPCSKEAKQEPALPPYALTKKELARFNEPGYYYSYGDTRYESIYYDWDERDNPCNHTYYRQSERKISRNVLVSNLGIIAKRSDDNKMHIAISDINTTESMIGADVVIYNLQHQVMAAGKTNAEGFVVLDLDYQPFLLEATYNNQKGYLRLDDGSSLSLSMFNTGGAKNKEGIKGYIYAERGVWRPGDSIYVSFFLEDKNERIPENHPVVFNLNDPNNQQRTKLVSTSGLNGLYDFRTKTSTKDITGNWLAKVTVGGSTFTKTIRIETVKPNRLKNELKFSKEMLHPGAMTGTLTSKWLHGAPAKGLRSIVEMKLAPGKTQFEKYNGYTFDDPTKTFEARNNVVFEGKLDQEGVAKISTSINVKESAPGMLNAKFTTRTFEVGGDFSTTINTFPYAPYGSYAGVKIPKGKGWNGAIYSDETTLIPIVTVNKFGKPVDRKRVKIEIFRLSWNWWWERNGNDDIARYVHNTSTYRIKTDYVDTKDGEAMFDLTFPEHSWGRKYIRVTDPVSGHSTGTIFYTDYKGWWDRDNAEGPGGAEMLSFTTKKKSYTVGEMVEVSLPEATKARALVSLETGSKIVKTFWADINASNNKIYFEATGDMAPNVYIHVTLIQPHSQTHNDLPIRMYGIEPIEVKDPETHLSPVIDMPETLEPEEEVSITVSEKDGKPMTYTVAVVDDGLLDLTQFKTPSAWKEFYKHEALGVKTWDMYKYVMNAISGRMAGLLAVGGDENVEGRDGKEANRFVPVVKFFGPFAIDGESKTHTFTMPNYIGSVRTMVVAGQDGAYGSVEKTTPVKKPLMVLATLPRVVGPTEQVKLPVTVFALDEDIDEVDVRVKANNLFLPLAVKEKEMTFSEVGEQTIDFDLTVAEKLGVGEVEIEVQSGGERATYRVELQVRNPNPEVSKSYDTVISPGKQWEQSYEALGMTGTNTGTLELSSIPPLSLERRMRYLIRYPHGCVEQTTSSGFPQLYLGDILDLSESRQETIETNIKKTIERLRRFQTSEGGLSYWIGDYGESHWGTSYAGHFILEAQKKGYSVSTSFLRNWVRYQTRKANNWNTPNYSSSNERYHWNYGQSELNQAYRLYTLALAKKPAMGAMNRLRESKRLSKEAKWRLASAYAMAGREKVALQLITELDTTIPDYTRYGSTFGSQTRDKAMILQTLAMLNKHSEGKNLMTEIAKKLSSQDYLSTQSTAWALLSIVEYIGKNNMKKGMKYEITLNGDKSTITEEEQLIKQTDLNLDEQQTGKVSIANKGTGMLFATLHLQGTPIAGQEVANASNLKMEVVYYDSEGKVMQPNKIKQGTDFKAKVTIKHTGVKEDYEELALAQIFPSGWEIRNQRLEGNSSSSSSSDHQDIRDDRIYTYFDLKQGTTKSFTVILNAAYKGKYYLPGVSCEAMYDNTVQANTTGMWVEVE